MAKVMVKPVDDWPVEQVKLLGLIVTAFSHIEQGLHNTPKRMRHLKWDEYMKWDKNFTAHERILQARAEGAILLPPDQFKQLDALLNRVEAVKGTRNALLHALWGKEKGVGNLIALHKGKRLDISVPALKHVLKSLHDAGAELNTVWRAWPKPDAATLVKVKVSPSKWDFKKKKQCPVCGFSAP